MTRVSNDGVSGEAWMGPISRRRFLGVAGAAYGALAVGGLSACGGSDDDSGGDGSYSGQFPFGQLNAIVAGAVGFYCLETGIFERHQLDLKLLDGGGGATAVHVVQSNSNIGLVSAVGAATSISKGVDLKILSGFVNVPTTSWVAPKGSSITVDSLKGKKIGSSSPDSITTYFANLLVESKGLKPGEDVDIVFVGGAPDAWTAVERGVVDLAWSALPFSTVLVEREGARIVLDNQKLKPDFVDNVIIATNDFVESDGDTIRRMLSAFDEGIRQIQDDPSRAARIWAKEIDIPEAVARTVLESQRSNLGLQIDAAGINAAAAAAVQLGGAKKAPSIDQMVDDSFLPGAAS